MKDIGTKVMVQRFPDGDPLNGAVGEIVGVYGDKHRPETLWFVDFLKTSKALYMGDPLFKLLAERGHVVAIIDGCLEEVE